MYVDEAGIDKREEYPYGYCEIGQRFHSLKSGRRSERVSWIAALKQGKVFAPMTFKGSCNRDLFEMWLEECLVHEGRNNWTVIKVVSNTDKVNRINYRG